MNPSIVSAHPESAAGPQGRVTVSIVSHAHNGMVELLLARLCEAHGGFIEHCVVTHNLPEASLRPPKEGWPFRFTELFNEEPAGFGANHNRAFKLCASEYFCVLNPDIDLPGAELWAALVAAAQAPGAGLAYPILLNPDGTPQDNERETVTPAALFGRHVLHRPRRRIDWVSAAFWLVPAQVYRRLGGFDEGFFMYCEDTDFCLRLRLAGWGLSRADVSVVHHAKRNSRRLGRHLAWHVRSLMRLWSGPVLRRYMAGLASG